MPLLTPDSTHAPLHQPWVQAALAAIDTVERVAFWLAVLIPFAYLFVLPALVLDPVDLPALLGVMMVHAIALLTGHYHVPRR